VARLFKNLKLAFDVLKLTFDYRFFLKSGLNFTLLGANREIFGNQFLPLKLPITMIDRRGIIDNLQERLGMLRQLENLLLAVNPDRKSLCYVSLGSAPGSGSGLFLYGVPVVGVRPGDSKATTVFSEADSDFRGIF